METLARSVYEHVKHPHMTWNSKYDYGTAFQSTMYMLRKGDSNRFLFHMLPPSMRSDNEALPSSDRANTLRRWQRRIVKGIVEWADQQGLVRWLTGAEWRSDTEKVEDFKVDFPNILPFFVDGTPLPTFAPGDARTAKIMWNSKHAEHAFQIFVLVSPIGRIVYSSHVEGGKMHDKTQWEKENVSKSLYDHYSSLSRYREGKLKVGNQVYQLAIGGDKAYRDLLLPAGWHGEDMM
tara:strand:+ start:355 stop:1059 length:705 start_codon:yes stop_codon:yes gene_type:complete